MTKRYYVELNYINAAELEPGYIVFTATTDKLKGVDIPLGANPRKPSMANKNVKAMITQLEEDPTNFRRKNEGISIIADEAVIDKENKRIIFEVNDRQGIINGGHTYYTLKRYGVPSATVRIEVTTGVSDELTTDIAHARNSSKRLSLESQLHHAGLFEWVKESISPELVERIRFFEGDEGSVDIGELIQVANVVYPNGKLFNNAKQSYESKNKIFRELKKYGLNAPIVRTRKCLEDLWELYTYICTNSDLRDRLSPVIYEKASGVMYKGVALLILAGALSRRVDLDKEGYVLITNSTEDLKKIVLLNADEIREVIIKYDKKYLGDIGSMVANEHFRTDIEVTFLR